MNDKEYMIAHKCDFEYEEAEYFNTIEAAINAMTFGYELYRLNDDYEDVRYSQYHESEVQRIKKTLEHGKKRAAFHKEKYNNALLNFLNAINE